jgi:phospholipid/cholesterol/gamma-HCH transport system substrate-binding protein
VEKDANYVAVGAFVLVLAALAVGFVYWYSRASGGGDFDNYEIYFTGSVSGLTRGGPVRYLGVDVGRVRSLTIDRKRPGQVKTVVEIDHDAPISPATRASLALQGVTGLLFINLKEAERENAGTATAGLVKGDEYPVIPSVASDFDVFLASLPELMGRANELIDRVQRVFSDQNLKTVDTTLDNLRATTDTLPKTARDVSKLVEEMHATVLEVHNAATNANQLLGNSRPEIDEMLKRFNVAADNLAKSSERVDRFVASGELQLGHFSEHGLFELEQLVRESRAAAREFRDLSRSLKQNPSQLIYEQRNAGVEIAK